MEDHIQMITLVAKTSDQLDADANSYLKDRGWQIISAGRIPEPWDGNSWWVILGKMAMFT